MTAMNRNVITRADVNNFMAATSDAEMPRTLDSASPGKSRTGKADAAGAQESAPTQDDYLTKLLKYVPPEVIGAYLVISSTISGRLTTETGLQWWLGSLLVVMAMLTVLYNRRVLNVVRKGQHFMSVLGFVVYVFALGGWFATTTWYHAWHGSIALFAFAFLTAVFPLTPLPKNNAQTNAANEVKLA